MATAAMMRRCEITGLSVDRSAERLIMLNAVTAVVYLTIGGVLALLITLTRWQAVHLLAAKLFYEFLSTHGVVMLIFWILFFEVAGLIFASTVLLSTRMVIPWLSWVAYVMMLGGSVIATVLMLSGQATVMFTSYPPLRAETPWYYAAVLVFAVGAILAVVHFFVNIVAARLRGDVGSLPLFTFALMGAAIIALWSLLSGALALFPVFLWTLGVIPEVDPGIYRLLYWGLGHGAQQVNLAAMVGVWYGLASLTTGARPVNEGLSRIAIVLYVLFINMGAMHHLLVDPGLGTWVKNVNASYFMYAAVMGSLIHAFSIPASMELALRERGYRRGLFEWLRRAPWGEPGFAALVVSMILFGLLGGISGVIIGGPQVNMISHNTLLVPAHFHMTVVAGTTSAFMGIAYYLVPLIFQRQLLFRRLAQWQPYVYGFGMLILGLGMGLAGHWGVPRRHWDITFSTAPVLGVNLQELRPEIAVFLAMMGIGGIIAVIGGAMFVAVAVATVFVGHRTPRPAVGRIVPEAFSPYPAIAGGSGEPAAAAAHRTFEVPGTLVISVVFLILFIFLYGFSWFELSRVPWKIG
ncbi:cbb3-type cytochrome c oxidase subunit I [Thermomicrobium sp. CFH 73360]|uniref:cbb3-type cytochrome c oxidase subunit I n=1 Tax=Thermomicrobium sp. CFH 73360 TaxID=2951987 RepID=UPI0020774461|nr:cbb3-type cytochrome c oxidase subunit I [Thermomicrobium sp. CFH 73360]MCM8746881.1 cbb3-type cytochrome c oxidase subunit I [Thermomicrobium sp. CFH 73360]